VVRYRLGGRAYPVEHAGSLKTLREARVRRDLVGGEIAAGRNPQLLLAELRDPAPRRLFADWSDAYKASRIDVTEATARNLQSQLAMILTVFGSRDPATITPDDVQEWITSLRLKPGTMRRYVATLRQVLDYAGVEPNPARDARIRLPR
jgi:hypothetical protein